MRTSILEVPERSVNYLGRDNDTLEVPMQSDPITLICECGCGESFTVTRHRPSRPKRFIAAHRSRTHHKQTVTTLSEFRRRELYAAVGECCQSCGRGMAEQVTMFGRRLEIHHKNHDHSDNTEGNHEVLCTACHNHESLVVRDEVKKSSTFRARLASGAIKIWSKGLTKEISPALAAMAEKKRGQVPWNKRIVEAPRHDPETE